MYDICHIVGVFVIPSQNVQPHSLAHFQFLKFFETIPTIPVHCKILRRTFSFHNVWILHVLFLTYISILIKLPLPLCVRFALQCCSYGVKDRRETLEVNIENFKDLLKRGHCASNSASNSAIGTKKVSILVKC